MKAVIYARYSSHAQKDASIEQQIRECRKYARDHDLQIVGEYCDHAISGTSDRRPEFLRMIKDSAKGKWQRVLVYKVDRFARNRYDSAMYKARLKKNGVKVMSVMEPIPEGPEGILLESVLEGSAEYYSANLSQNIRRGMEDNALSCKVNNGRLPLGLKKGDDGRYAIEPAGAAIVREIFERYANGENVREITDELNARGILTSHGARWNKNSLHTILKNERYAGVYIWSNIRVEGGIPPIVSRELFEAVQDRLRIVAKAPAAERTDVDYLLTGKLFCGRCGSPMTGESGTGKSGRKFYYYSCVGRKRFKTCEKKPVKKDWIEETVVRQTRERCLTDEMIRVIVDSALELQEREKDDSVLRGFEAELAEVKRGIGNILKAIEQGIITPSTKGRLEELEARRLDLEEAIEDEKVEQPQLTREQLTFWLERFRDGDPKDPAYWSTFIDVFVSAVYVYDDHLRIVCNFTGEKGAITFDFVNGIEDYEEAVEVFDFDAHASTIVRSVEPHKGSHRKKRYRTHYELGGLLQVKKKAWVFAHASFFEKIFGMYLHFTHNASIMYCRTNVQEEPTMARRKECMTLSFSAETKERLRIFAEQNHKTVSQAITDWIWSQKIRETGDGSGEKKVR